jgi:hypothetical protein
MRAQRALAASRSFQGPHAFEEFTEEIPSRRGPIACL